MTEKTIFQGFVHICGTSMESWSNLHIIQSLNAIGNFVSNVISKQLI